MEIGKITERHLRQETISSLKTLRRMINSAIRWKESQEPLEQEASADVESIRRQMSGVWVHEEFKEASPQ